MKKLLAFLTIISLVFTMAACSSDKDETANKTAKKENTTELTDQVKAKMYNALRIAELKVNEVFAKETAADETTPIIHSSYQTEEAAVTFLSGYYSEDIAKQIYTYYVTGQKTPEGQPIVKAEPFFTPSILDTTKDDVTTEGDANKATIKTKDNVTYTVELSDDHYVITNIQK